jgi:hypothetical protein
MAHPPTEAPSSPIKSSPSKPKAIHKRNTSNQIKNEKARKAAKLKAEEYHLRDIGLLTRWWRSWASAVLGHKAEVGMGMGMGIETRCRCPGSKEVKVRLVNNQLSGA